MCEGEIGQKLEYTRASKPGLAAMSCFALTPHMKTCESLEPRTLITAIAIAIAYFRSL